jgi:parvulin-like peptidyl-prolyl isomerase
MRSLANQVLRNKLEALPEPNLEQAAREAYQLNKAEFKSPPQVHARHILIAINNEQDEAAALGRAQELHAKLQAQPERMAELARAYSDDPGSAERGGDLGFFAAGQMVKPFAEAAFALKEGEISQPVLSQFGYHIIQTLEHRQSRQLSFEEVREQLLARQQKGLKNRQREQLIQELQSRDSVVYHRDAIDALHAEIAAE